MSGHADPDIELEKAVEVALGRFEKDLPLLPKEICTTRGDPYYGRRHKGYHVDMLAMGRRDWSSE